MQKLEDSQGEGQQGEEGEALQQQQAQDDGGAQGQDQQQEPGQQQQAQGITHGVGEGVQALAADVSSAPVDTGTQTATYDAGTQDALGASDNAPAEVQDQAPPQGQQQQQPSSPAPTPTPTPAPRTMQPLVQKMLGRAGHPAPPPPSFGHSGPRARSRRAPAPAVSHGGGAIKATSTTSSVNGGAAVAGEWRR